MLEQRGGKLLQLLPGTSSSQEQGERTVPERINYPRARGKPWPMYFDELPPKHDVDMLVFQSYVSLLEWIQWIDSMENWQKIAMSFPFIFHGFQGMFPSILGNHVTNDETPQRSQFNGISPNKMALDSTVPHSK